MKHDRPVFTVGGRAVNTLPSNAALHTAFVYEPLTGAVWWKYRPLSDFASLSAGKSWNTKYAGTRAGFSDTRPSDGRRTRKIKLDHMPYLESRIIWKLFYGREPRQQIDHINGDATDNRLVNLREVAEADNQKNKRTPCNNTSGRVGVYCLPDGKYVASIQSDNIQHHLGTYANFDAASAARTAAELNFGFHENHGRNLTPTVEGNIK